MSWYDDLKERFSLQTEPEVWQQNKGLEGTDLASSGLRYGAWWREFSALTEPRIEYLLPRITIGYQNILPSTMLTAEARYRANPESARLLSQKHWGYYFNLGGGLSTVDSSPPDLRDRLRAQSILRIQMINDVVEAIVGDHKCDTTVLDFASNWGGMAIDMAMRGFSQVQGFDSKEENVVKAKALSAYMSVNNVEFETANVFDLPSAYSPGFDVVYNLGLLYHVTDPVRLAQITFQLTRRVAVFDSLAHREPFAGYIQAYISDEAIRRPGMGEQQIELHPTYRGLIDLISFAGFRNLVEVVPAQGSGFPEPAKEPYFQGLRRTILAFKE